MSFNRRQLLRAVGIGFAAGPLGLLQSANASSSGLGNLPVEGTFPSLAHASEWLNSQPLSARDLRGKVVLVDFWTYTCINWRRTLPYVRTWAERYKRHGLVVVGAHTPEFGFERDVDNVRRAAKDMSIPYPIAIDNDYAIWHAFQNQYWPALYFIDANGRIRHHQFGEGGYDQSELVLQELLREAGASGVDQGFTPIAVDGVEAGADWRNLLSPETYVGSERTQNFTAMRGREGYAIPDTLKLNHWAIGGKWAVEKRSITSEAPNGRLAFRFHARDLHLVAGASAPRTAVRFRVSIDKKPPGHAHGSDIDEEGNGTLAQPRLYQLIRQDSRIEDRNFEIEFLDAGAQAFSFTFG